MPRSRSTTVAPLTSPAPIELAGEKVVTLRMPAGLAEWSLAEARRQNTTRTQKIIEFLLRWKAEVEAGQVLADRRRQAEIKAAVDAAVRADRRKRGAKR